MIRARHKRYYVKFFNWYSWFIIRNHFRNVNIFMETPIPEGPLLLIGNHFSWWDGFFTVYVNQQIFKRKVHIMMLEEQLQKRMFLNKAGAFSISKGSRSIIESLDYCREILSKRRNLLVIYPQGTIQSAYLKQFKFQKGLERLLTETGQDLQLVFMASLIEYFSERKPRLDIYLCRMPVSGKPSIKKIEAEYNRFFDACRSRQKD